jgi:3-oxoacyl-[acyl-carrier-protein] synthase III
MSVEAKKEKAEAELMRLHPDFDKLETVMTFTNGQKNSQNGYRMHFMKTTMMQGQQQELLTSTNQIETLVRKTQHKVAEVLLWMLARKLQRLKWILLNQVKRYLSPMFKKCPLHSMRDKLTQ